MKRNITISLKITAGLIMLVIPAVVIALSSFMGLSSTTGSISSYQQALKKTEAIAALQLAIERCAMPVNDIIILQDRAEIDTYKNARAEVDKQVGRVEAMMTSPEAKQLTAKIKADLVIADQKAEGVFAAYYDDTAVQKMEDFDAYISSVADSTERLSELVRNYSAALSNQTTASIQRSNVLNILAVLVAFVVFAIVFVFVRVQVIRPAKTAFEKITGASRDLAGSSQEIAASSRQIESRESDILKSTSDFAEALEMQASAMGEINQLVAQVSTAVNQVANGAQGQAKDVVEASNVMEQLASVVNDVDEKAKVVSEVASDSLGTAEKGKASVDEAISGMEKMRETVLDSATKIQTLGEKSKQIGEIIEVIDDIAEQTNLLALNAAIEAARAGEHGKGFAVVADEVRKLAERSAKATGEIAELIKGIQDETMDAVSAMEKGTSEVEAANQLAQNVGEAIAEMTRSTYEVMNQIAAVQASSLQMTESSDRAQSVIGSIASVAEENTALAQQVAASTEQVSRSVLALADKESQISETIKSLSSTAQESAAAVEQISAAMQQVAGMSEELDELVASFNW